MTDSKHCASDHRGAHRTVCSRLDIQTYGGGYQGHRDYTGFSDRVAVNCIRHNFTDYEKHLAYLKGRVSHSGANQGLELPKIQWIET